MNESLGRQFRSDEPYVLNGLDVATEYGIAKVVEMNYHHCYVYDVEIIEECRGRGHGSELMRKVIYQADVRGDVLTVSAREDHYGWYKRFGFEVVPKETLLGLPVLQRQPVAKR